MGLSSDKSLCYTFTRTHRPTDMGLRSLPLSYRRGRTRVRGGQGGTVVDRVRESEEEPRTGPCRVDWSFGPDFPCPA